MVAPALSLYASQLHRGFHASHHENNRKPTKFIQSPAHPAARMNDWTKSLRPSGWRGLIVPPWSGHHNALVRREHGACPHHALYRARREHDRFFVLNLDAVPFLAPSRSAASEGVRTMRVRIQRSEARHSLAFRGMPATTPTTRNRQSLKVGYKRTHEVPTQSQHTSLMVHRQTGTSP